MTRSTDPTVARRAVVGSAVVVGVVVVAIVVFGLVRRGEPSGAPRLTVTSAAVSEGEDVAAGYVTITNTGGPDALVGVTTDVGAASIHRTVDRGGTETMDPAASVPIKGGATVRLAPGGTHVMIEPLRHSLQPGDQVTLTLQFGRSSPLTVTASVESYSAIAASLDSGAP